MNDLISQRAYSMLDFLSNHERMLQDAQRLAASATPTADTFLTSVAARGGSSILAREQFEQAQRLGRASAFDAYRQMQHDNINLSQGLLGLLSELDQFTRDLSFRQRAFDQEMAFRNKELAAQVDQARRNRRSSFWNSLLGVGATLGGAALGTLLGGPGPGTFAGISMASSLRY